MSLTESETGYVQLYKACDQNLPDIVRVSDCEMVLTPLNTYTDRLEELDDGRIISFAFGVLLGMGDELLTTNEL